MAFSNIWKYPYVWLIRAIKHECGKNVESRLESAKRTKYALKGSGIHGTNGIDAIAASLRLVCGLQVLPLKKKTYYKLRNFS